jgi:hypothetical protein
VSDPLYVTGATIIVERASAEAVALLRDAGIRSILIKGPPQQQWLSAAGPPRESVDVDLLVSPSDVEAAGSALAARGYSYQPEVTPGVENHSALWSHGGRIPVEVHWTLSNTDPSRTWLTLERETESVEVAGEAVEIPNEAARCLIVALHASQHGPTMEETLHDLERAVEVAARTSWERAADLAKAVDAESAFVNGLWLVSSGRQLGAALGLEPLPLSERVALDLAPVVEGTAGFYWLAQQRGLGARGRFVARKLVPPADFMRFKYPYARRGTGHLALAYLHRAAWLVRSAPAAFVAWRRLRKTAGQDSGRPG